MVSFDEPRECNRFSNDWMNNKPDLVGIIALISYIGLFSFYISPVIFLIRNNIACSKVKSEDPFIIKKIIGISVHIKEMPETWQKGH